MQNVCKTVQKIPRRYSTLRTISKYGKSNKYVEEDQKELINMPLEEFKRIAAEYMQEDQMIYVIVGDKATQLEPVREFADGTVIELDIYGNRIE